MENSTVKKFAVTKNNYMSFFLVYLYALGALSIVARVQNISFLLNACQYAIYVSIFCVAVYQIVGNIKAKNNKDFVMWTVLVLAFLLVAITFIQGLVYDFSILKSRNYYYITLCFISALLLFYIIYNSKIGIKAIRISVILMLFITLYLIIMLFIMGRSAFTSRGFFTLGLHNPNSTAMMLLFIYVNVIMGTILFDKFWMRVISLVASAVMFLMIYTTSSRNALIVLLAFTVLFIWIIIRKKIKTHNWFWLVCVVFPLVFVLLYFALVYSSFIQKIFGFLVGFGDGKGLDSRVDVWSNAFDYFKKNILSGSYYLLHAEGEQNLHNSMLDMLARYGSVVFFVFSIYIYELISRINNKAKNKANQIGLLLFVALLMTGIGEVYFLYGSVGLFVLCGAPLSLARADNSICIGKRDAKSDVNKEQNK